MSQHKESVAYSGKIGEVIHTQLSDGRVFERYRRPPGVRVVFVSPENKILITKEYRHENDGYDLRLPGGKVRDTLEEYRSLLSSNVDMIQASIQAAKKEALEETGLVINHIELLTVANAGATVEWDLYYFIVKDYSPDPRGQQLTHGEDIKVTWLSVNQVREAVRDGNMSEWRSVGVLFGLVFPSIKN